MKFFQQIRSLRRLYDHPIELPNGNILWYRRQAVAETAKRRIAAGLKPPKPSKRLAGFGVGIRKAVDGFDVYLCRAYVDSAKTLEDAVQIWWEPNVNGSSASSRREGTLRLMLTTGVA